MSYYQSNNPSSPYYGYPNQHPQPSGSSYTYVTTPMMIPMPVYYGQHQQPPMPQHPPAPQQVPAPQPPPAAPQQAPPMQQIPIQPTYITNHVYKPQPASPVKPIEEDIDTVEWAPATENNAAEFKQRAFVAVKNCLGNSWIIRAHHCGDLVPGKWSATNKTAFIPHGGKIVPVHNFEILLAEEHTVCWKQSILGEVPTGAIVAGNTHDGEPLYIGRAKYKSLMSTGKVQPSQKCCYIPRLGGAIACRSYEVLCHK